MLVRCKQLHIFNFIIIFGSFTPAYDFWFTEMFSTQELGAASNVKTELLG